MSEPTDARTRFTIRLLAGCALLVGLAFVQEPGFLVPDTKFDLVAAPGDFLGRALHLWGGEGAFGQLQNQAYGYLWPMGPFFWLGISAGIPGWVVQRLWLGLVMSVAFTGAARVSRALGIRSDLACVAAGVAFALSPRMITTLGPISIEAWPSALAPWVLLPLVLGSERGSARQAAALSALAVAMVGGVNAAATFAVIPLGVVWLLTRTSGHRRRTLMLWWPLFTLLGTLWWLVPLFVMGAYSPPFLDYIETTSVTTFPTTVFDVLRGTSNWVPYVDSASRAGNDLVTTPYLVLNSGVLLLLGTLGLMGRWCPHRRFLVFSLLLGVLVVAAGHVGEVEGWFAADVRSLLDQGLSPLRNVHKFDPLVRLPLVIGFAVVLDRVVAARVDRSTRPAEAPAVTVVNRYAVIGMACAALVGSLLPAVSGRVTPSGAHLGVPDYWTEAAAWLAADEDDAGTTDLLIPGSGFGDYAWGSPKDEPMQSLATTPWAVRNVIPLTRSGNIRMLDAIEERLSQGDGSSGLVAYLRRAGVRNLVVRNDLTRKDDQPDPVLVHQAIAQSPGLVRAATFGPEVGGGALLEDEDGRILVNGGWQDSYPAVEIFRVPGVVASAVVADEPTTVVGGPEDLVDLLDLGIIGSAPTVLAADLDHGGDVPGASGIVLTDGLRARERFFPRVHDGASSVLTPGDRERSGNPSRDYLLDTSDRWSTTAVLEGAETLAASSSMSDSNALGGPQPGELPYAAVDDNPGTQWRAGFGDEQSWWRVTFDAPRPMTTVSLRGGEGADENQVLRVITQAGSSATVEVAAGETREVELPAGDSEWLMVEDADGSGPQIALAEVDIPGVEIRRRLTLPTFPEEWDTPTSVVMRSLDDDRTGCLEIDDAVRCAAGKASPMEEPLSMGRVLDLPRAGDWDVDLRVRPVAGRDLDRAILDGQAVDVQVSSTATPDPRGGAIAAVDGDEGTAWISAPDELRPRITLSWLGERRVSALRMSLTETAAARAPTRVSVRRPDGSAEAAVDDDGVARFPAVRTDSLEITVEQGDDTRSLGFDGQSQDLGVGISELEVEGMSYLPLGLTEVSQDLGCGSGPRISVNGRNQLTAVTASPAALLREEVVPARLCGADTIRTPAGTTTFDVWGNSAFAADIAILRNVYRRAVPAIEGEQEAVVDTGPRTRHVVLPDGDTASLLVLRQNANAGWRAAQNGAELDAVVVDGWQQGWALREPGGVVDATFLPDRTFRLGLAVGAGLLVLLAALTLMLGRGGRRGAEQPSLAERSVPALVVLPVAGLAAGLLAGWAGLAVAAATVVVAGLLTGRRELRAVLLASPVLLVAVTYSVRPWGDASGWAGNLPWTGYVALVSLVGVVAALGWDERGTRRGPFRRRAGRSTSR